MWGAGAFIEPPLCRETLVSQTADIFFSSLGYRPLREKFVNNLAQTLPVADATDMNAV